MGMGFAPTWLRQVSPLLHKTTLTNSFCWLFKSLHSVYRRDQFLRHRPEPAAACRSWIFMVQGALSAAGVRRVGYGLEVGRSVRTAGRAGHMFRHAHSL